MGGWVEVLRSGPLWLSHGIFCCCRRSLALLLSKSPLLSSCPFLLRMLPLLHRRRNG